MPFSISLGSLSCLTWNYPSLFILASSILRNFKWSSAFILVSIIRAIDILYVYQHHHSYPTAL